MLAAEQTDAAWRVTGGMQGKQFVLAETETLTVTNAVIGLDGHHRLIRLVTAEAGVGLFSHRLQSLNMVGVSVRGEDVRDAQALELLDDAWRVVGGVDQQGLLALRIAEQVDIVVVGAHREARELIHGSQSTHWRYLKLSVMAKERRIGLHIPTGRGLDTAGETIKELP